ncbi:MAG: hypothetical protein IJZ93_06665 [Clostridia bacterium]|nr:hypothetical protein [Clostridia bacterium]
MELNKIFTSGMIFAHSKPIRIFGKGSGTVTVELADNKKTHKFEGECWEIELPRMKCSGPHELKIDLDGKKTVLTDVYIGEVYLFSGQSNMQFKICESNTPADLYCDNPLLRTFATSRMEEGEFFFPEDGWIECKKENVPKWSAIGYLVGNEISKRKNIAVGVITCYQGASVIESWIPKGELEKAGISLSASELHYDHASEIYSKWNGEATLYDFALSQIIPFSLTGVIWYQGESDTSIAEAKVYAKELCIMINSWRKAFKNDTLPFVNVQIADYDERDDEAWHLLQDEQMKASQMIDGTFCVKCADVCEKNNIHPPTKTFLSKRIADLL